MKIKINNCSSPGASFTTNTENVVLSCYEWVQENKNEKKPFISFRKEASVAKNFNDNNARNIYPLLLKADFVNYQAGSILEYSNFFTKLGEAYVKAIQLERNIETSEEYNKEIKTKAITKTKAIKEEIIFKGIRNILKTNSNYQNEMLKTLKYILDYKKIDKYEFAYLLYSMQTKNDIDKNVIQQYRDKEIIIDVDISVRNDIELREKSGNNRNEGIDYLTSYSYFTSIFEQSGLIIKNKDHYKINENNINKIKELLEDH